jgi:hypothetical protein
MTDHVVTDIGPDLMRWDTIRNDDSDWRPTMRNRSLVFACSLALSGFAGAAAAEPAWASGPITGTWRLHTTDCFFGVCHYKLVLQQNGHNISGPAGSGIKGMVHGVNIWVGLRGASEDDWTCTGTLNSAKTSFSGTFTDGTGGSGTCNANKL